MVALPGFVGATLVVALRAPGSDGRQRATPRSSPVPDPRKVMKRIRLTGIGSWARGGGWRGLLGALVAISLLIEPIRTEQPAAAAGGGIRKWAARQVVAVRRSHGVDGTGVGIGVLSTGVATLITGEAAGDLPDRVTVLPGQAGEGDEGTATLAILRDLAPGGELYFATGLGGPARFAANLEALCRAGADVIVDDLFDYQETIYQGGLMAQAVQAAVRNGCVYVSARGNPSIPGSGKAKPPRTDCRRYRTISRPPEIRQGRALASPGRPA